MYVENMKTNVTISLEDYHYNFVKKKNIKLSKFVREKLDEEIKK
jgi:hypothetical protein